MTVGSSSPLTSTQAVAGFAAAAAPVTSPGPSFASMIETAISSVESARNQADTAASDLLLRGQGDVHTVALAAQSAELSFELFQQIRNKIVSAYQEVMKMPM